jgi:ABC-type glycerol-3-phosphate transport system substrate-binding protein
MQSRFGAAPPSITDKEAQAAFYMVPVAPPGATVSIQAMEKGVWIPPEFTIPGYYRALVPINKALDAIFNGRETAEQAMRDAVPEANRLLQGYGR